MSTFTQGQYDNFDAAITNLKSCHENMSTIFNQAKTDYENMPYDSAEATKLRDTFSTETVTAFNNCLNDIAEYIACLEVAKQQYLAANQASLN